MLKQNYDMVTASIPRVVLTPFEGIALKETLGTKDGAIWSCHRYSYRANYETEKRKKGTNTVSFTFHFNSLNIGML